MKITKNKHDCFPAGCQAIIPIRNFWREPELEKAIMKGTQNPSYGVYGQGTVLNV